MGERLESRTTGWIPEKGRQCTEKDGGDDSVVTEGWTMKDVYGVCTRPVCLHEIGGCSGCNPSCFLSKALRCLGGYWCLVFTSVGSEIAAKSASLLYSSISGS